MVGFCDVFGGAGVDAKGGGAAGVEVHGFGGLVGAVFADEVGGVFGEDIVFFAGVVAGVGEDGFALDGGGDEGGFGEAVVLVTGEEEAREAWFEGEVGHLVAGGGDVFLVVECAEVLEECFGFFEGGFGGWVEPAEVSGICDVGGFEEEDGFGEVDAVDFRGFEFGSFGVVLLAPEAEAASGGGASGASGALVGGGAGDFLDE